MANDNEQITAKEIFRALSKPLKIAFSIAITLTGISIIGSAGSLFVLFNDEKAGLSPTESVALISLIVFAALVLIGLAVLAFSSAIALVRFKLQFNQSKFSESCEKVENSSNKYTLATESCESTRITLQTVASKLQDELVSLDEKVNKILLARNILDAAAITALESSVTHGNHIVVMTSKFNLDTDSLIPIILDNIRNGASYDYLVPGKRIRGNFTSNEHDDFCKAVNNWWVKYKLDLVAHSATDLSNKNYSSDYLNIVQSVKENGNNLNDKIINKAKEYFCQHINEYNIT